MMDIYAVKWWMMDEELNGWMDEKMDGLVDEQMDR